MKRSHKLLIAGASVVALGAGGVGIANAVSNDDELVTGPEADRAARAAVQAVGGGQVVGVEREDDAGAAWEVEVQQRDGQTVEVKLSSDLGQVGVESDDDDGGTEDDGKRDDD